jgi:hypothetical protein
MEAHNTFCWMTDIGLVTWATANARDPPAPTGTLAAPPSLADGMSALRWRYRRHPQPNPHALRAHHVPRTWIRPKER